MDCQARQPGKDVATVGADKQSELVADFPRERLVCLKQPRFDFHLLRGRIEKFHHLVQFAELRGNIGYDQRIPARHPE